MDFISRRLALLLALFVVLATVPGLAAAEARAGGSVVVPEGQTVDGLEAFGGSVVVRGTVDGTLTAVAGDVTIAPSGRVTGNVETAAGSVHIAGTVGGDVSAAAGAVTVAEGATVGGNLDAGAGTVDIAGAVDGDVTVGAETIVLGPAASVGGDLVYDGRLSGDRDAVDGRIERDPSLSGPVFHSEGPLLSNGAVGVYGFLVNLALGALLLFLFPGRSRRVSGYALEAPVRAGGAGLGLLVVAPVVLVLVALTVVGIPLALVGALLFVVVAWVGSVYGRIAVGTWLLSYTRTESQWAALVVGFLIVAVAVRIPWLGWLTNLLVLLLGLGALLLVAADRRRARRDAVEEVPEPGVPPV